MKKEPYTFYKGKSVGLTTQILTPKNMKTVVNSLSKLYPLPKDFNPGQIIGLSIPKKAFKKLIKIANKGIMKSYGNTNN